MACAKSSATKKLNTWRVIFAKSAHARGAKNGGECATAQTDRCHMSAPHLRR